MSMHPSSRLHSKGRKWASYGLSEGHSQPVNRKTTLRRFALFTVGGSLAVWLIGCVAWHLINQTHFRKALPQEFQCFSLVTTYDSASLGDYLVMFIAPVVRGESRGCAIFRLSSDWHEIIQLEGLQALQALKTSDGQGRDTRYYGEWKPTPIPQSWLSSENTSGAWQGLDQSTFRYQRKVMEQLRQPGAYYTKTARGEALVILPGLRRVIYTYAH